MAYGLPLLIGSAALTAARVFPDEIITRTLVMVLVGIASLYVGMRLRLSRYVRGRMKLGEPAMLTAVAYLPTVLRSRRWRTLAQTERV